MEESEVQQIAEEADEAIAALDVAAARNLLKQLDGFGVTPEQGDAAGVLYRDLLFVRLPQLAAPQSTWLLQHCVLAGLMLPDFDLSARIVDAMSIVFDEDERVALVARFVEAIEQGTELLGTSNLTIEGAEFPPTVQSWIKDYKLWPAPSPERKGLDELNYANQSPNAKKLDQVSRNSLLGVLGLYDTLHNSIVAYNNLPEIYVEDHPRANLSALAASPDEFDSLKAADDAYVQAAKSIVQSDSIAYASSPVAPQRGSVAPDSFSPSPNIQGVLVQTPLGVSENSGLDMVAPTIADEDDHVPTSSMSVTQRNDGSVSQGAPTISDGSLPVAAYEAPEDLSHSASIPAQGPIRTGVRPVPLATAPVSKLVSPIKLAKPVPSMDELKHEAEARRDSVQADIDSKLNSLKKKAGE